MGVAQGPGPAGTPGPSRWPEVQALTRPAGGHGLLALLAPGLRLGGSAWALQTLTCPPRSRTGRLLAATLMGARNQKQPRARGAQQSSRQRGRVHRSDTC